MTALTDILSKGSAGFRKANAHLFVAGGILPPDIETPAKPRLRQSSATLNKTEQRFHDWHKANFPDRLLLVQAVTLKLANGCRYTPDFVSFHDNQLAAYEVKGPHAWDDAIVKLKVAATLYPFIAFVLVSWNRADDCWNMEGVKP